MALTFNELDESRQRRIATSVQSGSHYLLLGAGVSHDSLGPNGNMLLGSQLQEKICTELSLPPTTPLNLAAGMLEQSQKDAWLTNDFQCYEVGPTIAQLASTKWKRIYTFNIDDCFEKAFTAVSEKFGFTSGQFETFNFDEDFQDIRPEIMGSIVHLHGYALKPSSDYIFSHIDYTKMITRPNAWMNTLSQLIRVEPFIIAGTALSEIDMEYYASFRTGEEVRSDTPDSVLIELYPNKLTEKMCEKKGLILFEGTVLDFFASIKKSYPPNENCWEARHAEDLADIEISNSDRIKFFETFEVVPTDTQTDRNPAAFLLGGEISWDAIARNTDVPREVTGSMEIELRTFLERSEGRIFLLTDHPGAGKTTLIRRLAMSLNETNVRTFWYRGNTHVAETDAARILSQISGPVVVFVDNWADSVTFFMRMLSHIERQDIKVVCAERDYRIPYIESSMTDEDYFHVLDALETTANENLLLIKKLESEGLSTLGQSSRGKLEARSRSLVGNTIAASSCIIKNNFRPFDQIISDLISESTKDELFAYLVVALARHCYAGGVKQTILYNSASFEGVEHCLQEHSALPIAPLKGGASFVVPRQAIIGDRLLDKVARDSPDFLLDVFVALANSTAPFVTPRSIKNRSPESRLSGRLLDFDSVVKRFIDNQAENLYERIKPNWDWTARYWEQLALLKFDRFILSPEDSSLIDQGIQHARHAKEKETHPFSLTTLAKLLLKAMDENQNRRDEYFREAFLLLQDSIKIEQRWTNVKATVFVVCFKGVIRFFDMGGALNGVEVEALKDIVAYTHAKKFNDRNLISLRDAVASYL